MKQTKDRIAEGMCDDPQGREMCRVCRRNRDANPSAWSDCPDVAPIVRGAVCRRWLCIPERAK